MSKAINYHEEALPSVSILVPEDEVLISMQNKNSLHSLFLLACY